MRFFVVSLVVVGALVACLARVVHLRHTGVDLAYAIGRATVTQRGLEEEVERLHIDRAALLDPARLEPIARAHGLRVATPDEIVVLAEAVGERAAP